MTLARGQWAAKNNQFGSIKEVHSDGSLDIVLYTRNGDVIGRESPALDGPTGFEPCCDPEGWRKIRKPAFPLPVNRYLDEVVTFI